MSLRKQNRTKKSNHFRDMENNNTKKNYCLNVIINIFNTRCMIKTKNLIKTWWKCVKTLICNKRALTSGLVFLITGLVCSFVVEIYDAPHYNTITLLTTMGMINNALLPSETIRPHLVITCLIISSIFMDIYNIYYLQPDSNNATIFIKVLTTIIMISKVIALYDFLAISAMALKARKYLCRFRIFLPHIEVIC